MEVKKIYWCEQCGFAGLGPEKITCPTCKIPLEEIGFQDNKANNIQKKPSSLGGRTIPGNCKCGNTLAIKGIDNQGRRRYRSSCSMCRQVARRAKTQECNSCGIRPENKADLDVDHIDGDRSNNDIQNLQTLCKPCHKDKTKRQEDWKHKNA